MRLIRRSSGGTAKTSGRRSFGLEEVDWNQKVRRGRAGQDKHEQRRFKARWELYFCPLPCCQVNAIGLFYKWDYSCWHFQCTSYTSSPSSPWLLILYTVSPRLCKAPSRTVSGGVSQVQVMLNIENQRSWQQIHPHYRVNTIILLLWNKL